MEPSREPTLRNRFSRGRTPGTPASLSETCTYAVYAAVDGAFDPASGTAGFGVRIESTHGDVLETAGSVGKVANSVLAEYHALFHGIHRLAAIASDQRVGILVDFEPLARMLNQTARFVFEPRYHDPVAHRVPESVRADWRGLERTIETFRSVRAAHIPGTSNPAHRIANAELHGLDATAVVPPADRRLGSETPADD